MHAYLKQLDKDITDKGCDARAFEEVGFARFRPRTRAHIAFDAPGGHDF